MNLIDEMKKINHRSHVPGFLKKAGLTRRLCEVGVWRGDNLKTLLLAEPEVIVGIDLFNDMLGIKGEDRFMECFELSRATTGTTISIIKGDSSGSATLFEDGFFDFIYIDADHRYEAVKKDIESFWRLIRAGGIMAGHDYKVKHDCGVMRAVNEFVTDRELERRFHITREPVRGWNNPSWFIMKGNA